MSCAVTPITSTLLAKIVTHIFILLIYFTVKHEELYEQTSDSPFKTAGLMSAFGNFSVRHALRNENVQKLIHSKNLHFDLIINEEIMHDAFLAFGHKFRAPVVTICEYIQSTLMKKQRIYFICYQMFRSAWISRFFRS